MEALVQLLAIWHRDNLTLYAVATVLLVLGVGVIAASLAAGFLTLAGVRPSAGARACASAGSGRTPADGGEF